MDGNSRWLRTRGLRQQAFLDFLAQRPDEAEIEPFLFKIVLRGHEVVEPEYESISEARWQRFETLLGDILLSLTPAQRSTAVETLREYAAELLELSG